MRRGSASAAPPLHPIAFWRLFGIFCMVLVFCHWGGFPAYARLDVHPLAPPDTTSPRNSLAYFIQQMDKAYQIQLTEGFARRGAKDHVRKATRSLDLSQVAPANRKDVGFETALLLKEILDRLEVPPSEDIPDAKQMASENRTTWTIPDTEITIARIKEGPKQGQFLFSADTVDHMRDFYNRIKELPYKKDAPGGIYEEYIFSPGPLVPVSWINRLPNWALIGVKEQAVWQWIAALLLVGFGALAVTIVFRWSHSGEHPEADTRKPRFWRRVSVPFTLLAATAAVRYLVDEQVNLTGIVLEVFVAGMRMLLVFSVLWLVLLAGGGFTEAIISSPRLRPKHVDPNLTRLLCKLFTWIVVIVLIVNLSEYLGVSFTAVFASAGIAGVALALAARETLSNFFGGVMILMDRPFKTGDYIVLDSGERGMVVNVGMRSTRILTRDDIQIAIPNSIITNTRVINESAPLPLFRIRIKVGVAYGSDIDQVEHILLAIARQNDLVSPTPEPRVRFRAFGDSALEFELLCWARRPHDKGRLIHGLNREIYTTFKAQGIDIPFPQRDVHLIEEA